MVGRLVLGCDATSLTLVESLAERRGELLVIESDESCIDQLIDGKIPAVAGDPTDVSTIAGVDFEPDIVLILGMDPSRNARAAAAVRTVFPDGHVLAFVGRDATRRQRAAIEDRVERLITPGRLLVEHLDERLAGGTLPRLQRLRRTLWNMDGDLGVFTHDNPDPDAIASALALSSIAEWFDVDADIYYYGDISHQENRAFVNLLEFDLHQVDHGETVDVSNVALVDHSAPGVNNQIPEDTSVDIVIDHHPPNAPVEAEFVDIRSDVGATSTLLVDYVRGYDIEIENTIATGLLYGIRVDTRDFSREITTKDFEAAAFLVPEADIEVLGRIESPSMSPETLDTIARSIRNRRMRGPVLTSCVGSIRTRDSLAQAADKLLTMDGTKVTVVYGYRDGTIHLSGRSRGLDMDLGATFRQAFDALGSAGGHSNMAGAQISLGVFDDIDEGSTTELTRMIENVVESHLFDVIEPDAVEE